MKCNVNIYKIRSFTLIKKAFIFVILIIFSSCLSIKPSGLKTGGKLYETFFVGEDGTQYFIKPLIFSKKLDEELKLDITFRYKNEIKDSAVLNISFFSKELFKTADSLKIDNDTIDITLKRFNYLFSERDKKLYNCRFSVKVDLINLKNLFNRGNWNLLLYKNGMSTDYTSLKTTKKKIEKINYEIFLLFK